MSAREPFTAPVAGGELGGWLRGDGDPVVLLHGGPGLSYDILEAVADDIGPGFRVAAYQQRGLEPSTTSGPFGIAQEIEDFAAVLDALGHERAWVVGHSWGGHLALRLAAACPDRLLGVVAIDPIGIVGDGGMAAFEAEMTARMPAGRGERLAELEAKEEAGTNTEADGQEAMSLYWPSYFGDPERTFALPDVRHCVETQAAIFPQMGEGLEAVAAAVAGSDVPVGLLAGGASPIPWGIASNAVAALSPRIQLTVEPGAGHFVWFEAPGSVRRALDRLRTS